jgi:hypothetical protein
MADCLWQRLKKSMAQGDNKTGQKVTNSIFVITHKEIRKIPKTQTVTYEGASWTFDPKKQTCIKSVSPPGAT